MLRRTPTDALFRIVLLTLLALGLCLQPTFAAACAIDDARSALGDGAGATAIAADVDGSSSAGDCCSNPLCSACCLSAVGALHCASASMATVMPRFDGSQRVDAFRPRDYPVVIRPPIAR